jgi:hypothetical protein
MASHHGDGGLRAGVTLIFIGFGLIYRSMVRMQKLRKTTSIGCIPVASAPQGLVELEGFSWPLAKTFVSLHGHTAVYKKVCFEKRTGSGNSSHWETLYAEESADPFYFVDESGLALVHPFQAQLDCHRTQKSWSRLTLDERMKIRDDLAPKGIEIPSFSTLGSILSNDSFRYTEECILLGAPVFMMGSFTSERMDLPAMDASKSAALEKFRVAIKRMRLNPSYRAQMLDMNRDGMISDTEAAIGYNAAATVAFRKTGTDSGPASSVSSTSNSVETNRICGSLLSMPMQALSIADCDKSHLTKRLDKWNHLQVLGGAALVGLGVYLIGRLFHTNGW